MKNKSTFRPLAAIFCGLTATAFAIDLPPNITLSGGDPDANNYTVTEVNAGVGGYGTFTGTFDAANQFLISPSTASGPLTFNGTISGVSGIQIQPTGANPVIFNGANSFAGAVNLNGATLRLGNASALGTTGAGTVIPDWGGGGVLDVYGQTIVGESLTNNVENSTLMNSAATNASWSGDISSTPQLLLQTSGAGNLNLSGAISGSKIQVQASGGGSVVLSGNNAFTGDFNIAGGNVKLGSATALGTTGGVTALQNWNGGWSTLDLNGQSIVGETLINAYHQGALFNSAASNASWSGNITAYSSLIIQITGAGGMELSGVISGTALQIQPTAGGVLTLSGSNTYTGDTVLNGASVKIGNANALGGTAAPTYMVGWNGGASILDLNGFTVTGETLDNQFTNGRLCNNAATGATWAGNIVATEQTAMHSGAGGLTVSGAISGTHVQVDGGAVILSGNNTYTGATTIANSRVFIGHANALGTTAGQTYIAGWGAWGAVDLNGFTVTGETLTFDQGGNLENSAAGAAAWNGNVNNNVWMVVRPTGGTLTVGGNITGAGGIGKNEASTAIFSGTNTYLGATNIDQGTLEIASGGSITSPTNVNIASAGTLKFSGGSVSVDGGVGYILNSGTMDVNGQTIAAGSYEASPFWAANAKLTNSSATAATILGWTGSAMKNTVWFNQPGAIIETVGNLTIDSIVTDGGSDNGFTKTGNGTLFLTSSGNYYNGETIISAGTLSLSNPTLSDSSTVRINGGTLNLNFSGQDQVDKAYAYAGFIFVRLSPGLWGSGDGIGITGPGYLRVAQSYNSWADDFTGPALADKSTTGDPDNDGLSNAVEYALGLDPRYSDGSPGEVTNGGKTITFTKGNQAKYNDKVTYEIETSISLGVAPTPWTVNVADVTETADTIAITFPAGPVKDFARLKVTLAP